MASGTSQLSQIYLQRLVAGLFPPNCDRSFLYGVVGDILLDNVPSTNRPLNSVLSDYKTYFTQQGKANDFNDFHHAVDLLVGVSLSEAVAKYLVKLAQLLPQIEPSSASIKEFKTSREFDSSPNASFMPGKQDMPTLAETILRYVPQVDPKLYSALLLALTGQETGIYLFLADPPAVAIPNVTTTGSTALLTEILEAGLLYRNISLHIESARGVSKSPIKAALLRFSESFLLRYANEIDKLFQTEPSSLIIILKTVKPYVSDLRLLIYFERFSQDRNGLELLSKIHDLSQFGDARISQLTSELLHEVIKPYYQYIEHWIIKGELIDEHDEFFVQFDKSQNHISDIIKLNTKLLPKFLDFEEEIFEKILQIGKTYIFLEKYCKELLWTSSFSSRFYNFIFKTHAGIYSMRTSTVQEMISCQYSEIANFLCAVVQSKMHLFLHLGNLKKIMFSEAGDFVEAINQQGHSMFVEPAMYLTPSRLSNLLSTAVSLSSVQNLPAQYVNRIDARILDLSHGTVGWDVFTLEYKTPEIPLEALLNYNNQLTEYLRLFNFLWGLRHFIFLLQQSFVLYQRLQKHELRLIKKRSYSRKGDFGTAQYQWVQRSVRSINLVRHRLLHVVQAILRFVSYDLIEKNFNEELVKVLFRLNSATAQKSTNEKHYESLPILNSSYMCVNESVCTPAECETVPKILHNVNDCTLDEILGSHRKYLSAITGSKLLRESMRGKVSGESLVDQVYGFLEVAFSFVQACDQFESDLSQLAGLLKLDAHLEDDIEDNLKKLEGIMQIIMDLYKNKFIPKLELFRRDLRAEPDLKDLSKSL